MPVSYYEECDGGQAGNRNDKVRKMLDPDLRELRETVGVRLVTTCLVGYISRLARAHPVIRG